jgi:hypothetical protein
MPANDLRRRATTLLTVNATEHTAPEPPLIITRDYIDLLIERLSDFAPVSAKERGESACPISSSSDFGGR